MKARACKPVPPMAVGINISQEKAKMLEKILKEENVGLILADSSCGGKQVGYLCKFAGFAAGDTACQTNDEIIIFSGIAPRDLDRLLKRMRLEGCGVDLKAVVTKHNQRWTVSQLACELKKEHEYFLRKQAADSNG